MLADLTCQGVVFSKENLLFNIKHLYPTPRHFVTSELYCDRRQNSMSTFLAFGFYRIAEQNDAHLIHQAMEELVNNLFDYAIDYITIRQEILSAIAECIKEWDMEELEAKGKCRG